MVSWCLLIADSEKLRKTAPPEVSSMIPSSSLMRIKMATQRFHEINEIQRATKKHVFLECYPNPRSATHPRFHEINQLQNEGLIFFVGRMGIWEAKFVTNDTYNYRKTTSWDMKYLIMSYHIYWIRMDQITSKPSSFRSGAWGVLKWCLETLEIMVI